MIARPHIMCFDLGSHKIYVGFSAIPFKFNLQGPQNRGSSGGRIEDP